METRNYDIHICRRDEYDKLITFIDKHWSPGHILAKSKALMDFQHYNSQHDNYNYVVAVNKQSGEIDACMGFISPSQYDQKITVGDYWGAIWKKRDDVHNEESGTLGLLVFMYLRKLKNYRSYGVIGISEVAQEIYKQMHLQTGILQQFYIANPHRSEYHICVNPKISGTTSRRATCHLERIDPCHLQQAPQHAYQPIKTLDFIIARYVKHPIYKYTFQGIFRGDELVCILVLRAIQINDAKCLRIVDALGSLEQIGCLYDDFVALLDHHEAEYIDFMAHGIDQSIFFEMGFEQVDLDSSTTIIPNYFEPFVQKNIKVHFAYKARFPYVFFKADGDQDRPSKL